MVNIAMTSSRSNVIRMSRPIFMMSYTNNNTMKLTHILHAQHVQEMIWMWHQVNLGWLFKDFPTAVIVLVVYRGVFLIKTWNELRVVQNCLSFCSFSKNYQTLSFSCVFAGHEINRINRKEIQIWEHINNVRY